MTEVANAAHLFEFTGPLSATDLNTFLQNYLNNLLEQQAKLSSLIKGGHYIQAHAIAHTIKSNSLYIAAQPLSKACEQLEHVLKAKPFDEAMIKVKWQSAEQHFSATINYLKDYLT